VTLKSALKIIAGVRKYKYKYNL